MFEKDRRWTFTVCLSMVLMVALLAAPTSADSAFAATETATDVDDVAETALDTESDDAADNSTQASGGAVSSGLAKLSVHGYLTQAWATADFLERPLLPNGQPRGPSPRRNEVSLGIPEDGTTNYRFLALQFRYDISSKDIFVVQFSSRTLGFSPLQDFEDEIELDWAFYERRVGDNTSVKVGRVQIPIGIYNETRDVGTILPFYRPSFLFYAEGAFTTETVDGISLAHTFASDSDWSLDATVYAGEWSAIEVDPGSPENSGISQAKDGYGAQLWLNTPLSDLRIGIGGFSWDSEGGPLEFVERRNALHASFDGSFGRFTLQGEYIEEAEVEDVEGTVLGLVRWYVLGGLRITDSFHIWGQWESGEVTTFAPLFLRTYGFTFREEIGVSLNYFFAPNLVLKAEHHWVDEHGPTFVPDFSMGFPPTIVNAGNVEFGDGSYTIVALSVSF